MRARPKPIQLAIYACAAIGVGIFFGMAEDSVVAGVFFGLFWGVGFGVVFQLLVVPYIEAKRRERDTAR